MGRVTFEEWYRLMYGYEPRVLFRWSPIRGTDLATFENHADTYIVVGHAASLAGIRVFQGTDGRWSWGVSGSTGSYIIAELLRRAGVEVDTVVRRPDEEVSDGN